MARGKGPPDKGGFEFRFLGEGMSPGNIRLGELADVLSSIEQIVAGMVGRPVEEVVLGLTKVTSKSAGYSFGSKASDAAAALETWSDAVKSEDISSLPAHVREPSKKVLSFTRKHNCTTRVSRAGKRRPLVEITPDSVIEPAAPAPLVGHTTLYGYAMRIGGVSPRLMIRVMGAEEPITVDVATKHLAREIGNRLYTSVGLSGRAEWHSLTSAMLSFRAEELLPYEDRDLSESLGDLSALIGEDLDDITDVEGWLAEQRSAGDL